METFQAYTISYGESSCGCSRARTWWLYDHTGNFPKEFTDKEEAIKEAQSAMAKRGDDNWKVTISKEKKHAA